MAAGGETRDPDDYPWLRNQDGALELVVSKVEEEGFEMAVTLLVGGVFISGRLISQQEWARRMDEAGQQESDWSGAAQVATITKAYNAAARRRYEAVHVGDVRIWRGPATQPMVLEGLPWRGRILSVDGWFAGMVG